MLPIGHCMANRRSSAASIKLGSWPARCCGLGFCKTSQDQPIFSSTNDSDYQTVLKALRRGAELLKANPRVDMLPLTTFPNGTK